MRARLVTCHGASRGAAAFAALALLAACQPHGATGSGPTSLTEAPRPLKTAVTAPPRPTLTASSPSTVTTTTRPYSRAQFEPMWTDPDGNGCDARQDALAAATTNRTTEGRCKIPVADVYDRYSGRTFIHVRTETFDLDHVVSLKDAWLSGADRWTRARRVAYANNPAVLVITTASANRSKGEHGPDEWAPASHSGACWYTARYRLIKRVWRLHTTAAQRAAIRKTLATCNGG